MTIELADSERQIVAALLQKIETTKAGAESAINAFGQSIGIIIQNIVRARGGDPKAQYKLDPSGAMLIQSGGEPIPPAENSQGG